MGTPPFFLGIDLGTSSLKVLALTLDPKPTVVGRGRVTYPTRRPQPGWAEQDPQSWLRALRQALREALKGLDPKGALALGLSGQMHGIVFAARDHKPLYPAVIWSDARSVPLLPEVVARVPQHLWTRLGGPPAAGFAGPTLFWFARYRPDLIQESQWVLQPKDWLRLWLTSEPGAEPSDASATFLYDVLEGAWHIPTAQALEVPLQMLPPLWPSSAKVGELIRTSATGSQLTPSLPVIAGAADQAAAAVGNGLLYEGRAQLLLGSGGQILLVQEEPRPDYTYRTHLFRHALPGRWYRLAAVLNVGTALSWLRNVLHLPLGRLFALAQTSPPGAQGLHFKPYLLGERTPHMDPSLTGSWEGLRPHHTRADLVRAALEGIAYSLREALEALEPVPSGPLRVAGGLNHPFFLTLLAEVLGRPLEPALESEASAWGAALLAALGVGAIREEDLDQVRIPGGPMVEPGKEALRYSERFLSWRS